ncbi:hypothetical protein ANN_27804 [Periplaneta americana]|uniref:C2H2-type domain-containing protein n=1 Tax=Periplaneta americana TaxID=6978 RepID=A0ABQ8RV74_PERAM|nr:hypothetical protein ANN_27804 [Periplaneta americana]
MGKIRSSEFLEKYTQHTIPDESTLRKTYAPSIYDETIQKIRDEIKDSSIWVSIDETPDKEGRLVGNVVIGLLSEQYSERILLHCDVLEKCNNKTIVKLFNEAMGILWPKGIMYDNVLFFISDAAPYMVKAGQALSVVYPKLTHFTCVAHAFHPPSRVNVLKEMYPEIPLPPKPILTRWGTWLEAVEYYAEHIDSINNVLLALDSEDAVSIDTAKTVTCDISVKNDLAHIQHTFSCIIKTLKSLQNRHLSLSESFEIINSTVEQLNRGRGKVADAVRAKVDTVLSKTLDMKNYKVAMEVIKKEPDVDPLSIQWSDNTHTADKKPLSEEGNLLDLHLAGIKTECMDHSYVLTSETKVEETALPNNIVTMKCKAEEELCNLDTVKDELKLEVTTEVNEILTDSITLTRDTEVPAYSDTILQHKKLFNCDISQQSFSHCVDLGKYATMHTDEKPFKCHVCEKGYTHSSNLRRHVRIHTGKLPYECNDCGKNYAYISQLKKHSRVHTGEKPYKCVDCGKAMRTLPNLKSIHACIQANNHSSVTTVAKAMQTLVIS